MNDAVLVTTRLVAAFGDHRVAEEGLRKLWLYELVEAFKGYAPETVNKALGAVIRSSKFWPSIAEITEGVKATLPRPSLPVFREPVEKDRTPEEVKRRIEALAAMKRQYKWDEKFGKPEEEAATGDWLKDAAKKDFFGFDTETSDVSPALKALRERQMRRA